MIGKDTATLMLICGGAFVLVGLLTLSWLSQRRREEQREPYDDLCNVQCPNCGGYKPMFREVPYLLDGLMDFLMPLGWYDRKRLREAELFHQGRNTATCAICGYRFSLHDVPTQPIKPNQSLLNEYERRRLM